MHVILCVVEGAEPQAHMYARVILTKSVTSSTPDGDIELYSPVAGKTSFFQLQV